MHRRVHQSAGPEIAASRPRAHFELADRLQVHDDKDHIKDDDLYDTLESLIEFTFGTFLSGPAKWFYECEFDFFEGEIMVVSGDIRPFSKGAEVAERKKACLENFSKRSLAGLLLAVQSRSAGHGLDIE